MIALGKTPKQLLRHCSSAAQAMLGEHRGQHTMAKLVSTPCGPIENSHLTPLNTRLIPRWSYA